MTQSCRQWVGFLCCVVSVVCQAEIREIVNERSANADSQ